MTFNELVALGASVGAFLSAIATFLTVGQIKKQTESSYRPELVFSRVHFEAVTDMIESTAIPRHWVEKRPDQTAANDHPRGLTIPLRNVGLGAARSVKLVWDFDVATTVKRANDLAQKSLIPLYFEFDGATVATKSDQGRQGFSMWTNQRELFIDYVLPASVQKDPEPVRLPLAFVELCAAIVYCSFKSDEPKSEAFFLPKLSAALTYLDIAGEQHATAFELTVHPVGIYGDGNGMLAFVESQKRV